MSSWNFVLSWVEHEKSFITSGTGFQATFAFLSIHFAGCEIEHDLLRLSFLINRILVIQSQQNDPVQAEYANYQSIFVFIEIGEKCRSFMAMRLFFKAKFAYSLRMYHLFYFKQTGKLIFRKTDIIYVWHTVSSVAKNLIVWTSIFYAATRWCFKIYAIKNQVSPVCGKLHFPKHFLRTKVLSNFFPCV